MTQNYDENASAGPSGATTEPFQMPEPRVRIRQSPLWAIIPVIPAFVLTTRINAGTLAGVADTVVISFSVVAYTIISLGLIVGFRVGVDLAPSRCTVRSLKGTRHLQWGSIASVTAEPYYGTRRVVIRLMDGTKIPLRAPITQFPGVGVRRFYEDYQIIRNWWISANFPQQHAPLIGEPYDPNYASPF